MLLYSIAAIQLLPFQNQRLHIRPATEMTPLGLVQVSAVSPKTNTTNVPMLGAWTEGARQIVLFDTPGVVSPK